MPDGKITESTEKSVSNDGDTTKTSESVEQTTEQPTTPNDD